MLYYTSAQEIRETMSHPIIEFSPLPLIVITIISTLVAAIIIIIPVLVPRIVVSAPRVVVPGLVVVPVFASVPFAVVGHGDGEKSSVRR